MHYTFGQQIKELLINGWKYHIAHQPSTDQQHDDQQDLRIRRMLTERNPHLEWQGLKQRSVPRLVARNLVHLGASHWLQLRESIDRLLSRPVPVQITQ